LLTGRVNKANKNSDPGLQKQELNLDRRPQSSISNDKKAIVNRQKSPQPGHTARLLHISEASRRRTNSIIDPHAEQPAGAINEFVHGGLKRANGLQACSCTCIECLDPVTIS
jgi:hypothetical protein